MSRGRHPAAIAKRLSVHAGLSVASLSVADGRSGLQEDSTVFSRLPIKNGISANLHDILWSDVNLVIAMIVSCQGTDLNKFPPLHKTGSLPAATE